ncbi:MAG: translation initiation factor IF-2 [Myxococcota bacterium]|nr:translation initiation factor IF-2 [Myxococcota bacterium]
MSKVRVYEVARELGMNNRELLGRIQSLGIQVRNHMSALEPAEVERVRRALDKDKAENTVETRIRKTVIRRRTKKKPKPEVAEAPAAEAKAPSSEASPPPEPEPRPEVRAPEPPKPAPEPPKPAAEPAVAKAEEPPAPKAEEPKAAPEPKPEPKPEPVAEKPAAKAEPEPKPEPVKAPEPERIQPPPPPATGGPEPTRIPAQPPATATGPAVPPHRPSQPAPAAQRLGHANLPPGVLSRGNQTAPSAGGISEAARNRIVSQHAQSRGPRRREVGRRELGQPGRPTGGRRKQRISSNRKGMKTEITVPSAQKRIIKIEDNIALQTLAGRMSLKATDVLMKLMQMGMTSVTINSTLDSDTAKIIASEFNYEVENVAKSEDELINEMRGAFADEASDRLSRAPIITVMGHVDHGKTSLLDKIRQADVAGGEAGGITQHIGAYRVETEKGPIVFLDTPGHEAFTAMRARGAQATDVVVLVVAADDGVMPQTKEAINHAKAADVPIVVAVNKIDKPDAQPQQIRQELVGYGLQPEEWGGTTLFVDVSAISGQGVDVLLESLSLQAELLELEANPNIPAEAVVLEAYLDRGRGAVANVLVRNGTLRQGDTVVAGPAMGKVRALTDEHGERLQEAGPATPVEVLGLGEVPSAGDMLYVVENEERARELVDQRQKEASIKAKTVAKSAMERLQDMVRAGEQQELNLVIKSDVHGSLEALTKALTELTTEKVKVSVIHTGVGGITEQDVMLASASEGLIIGFNVRPAGKAGQVAKAENVEMRFYKVIYEAVDEVKKAMAGLLAPEFREKDLGKAEVRATFGIPKVGTIAGCYVTEGKILRNGKARLVRDAVVVWEGDIGSLRRVKDDVREVASGYECGIGLAGFNDIKEGDVIECFEMEEIEATL